MSKRSIAPAHAARFFQALGLRVRDLRKRAGYTQATMVRFGFSMRHWQQIEHGRPVTLTTLIRISEVFNVKLVDLLQGLSQPYPGGAEVPAESERTS